MQKAIWCMIPFIYDVSHIDESIETESRMEFAHDWGRQLLDGLGGFALE